jgi:hypothetical protein
VRLRRPWAAMCDPCGVQRGVWVFFFARVWGTPMGSWFATLKAWDITAQGRRRRTLGKLHVPYGSGFSIRMSPRSRVSPGWTVKSLRT